MRRIALIAAILISGTANQPIVTPPPIFATEPATIAEFTTITTTAAESTIRETFTTFMVRPSVCFAAQHPPFACDRCPDENVQPHVGMCAPQDVCFDLPWGCRRWHHGARCHSSIEECCHDEVIQASGFGTSYCIDKSHETTTTTTPNTGETVTVPWNAHCITRLPGTGGCGQCAPSGSVSPGVSNSCMWWINHFQVYELCYNSVEECCGGLDACIKASRPPETCITPRHLSSTCEPCPTMDEVYFGAICDEQVGPWEESGAFCRYAYKCPDPSKPEGARAGECHENAEDCCRSQSITQGVGYDDCMHSFNTEEGAEPECPPCPEAGDCPCPAVKIMLRDKPVRLELEVNNQKKM